LEFSKYAAYFGRAADFTLEARAGTTPAVSVGRFPPASTGLFRRFTTPIHDRFVYVTYGMSCKPMQIPENEKAIFPSTIELIAYTRNVYVDEHDSVDMVSIYLQALAALPFEMDIFFGPAQTAALEEPLSPNSQMSSFFFALPDGINMPRLCSCTPGAQLVLSVMPISGSERKFAVTNGPRQLIDLFERHRVPNLFDPFRRSVV
jgi:hypothetical protein